MSIIKRRKKMAEGGEVKKPKTLGDTIGYPKRMAHGGEVDSPRSIAQAIRSKKIQPEDPLEQLEPEFDELNEEAGMEPDEALDPSEGEDDFNHQNRIAAIRRKRMRG